MLLILALQQNLVGVRNISKLRVYVPTRTRVVACGLRGPGVIECNARMLPRSNAITRTRVVAHGSLGMVGHTTAKMYVLEVEVC